MTGPVRLLRLPLLAVAVSVLSAQGDPLAELNAAFRASYLQAKTRAQGGTILAVTGDRILLLRGGAIQAEAEIRPERYHRLKAVDHVPLALVLTLRPLTAPLDPSARASLGALRPLIGAARAGLDSGFPAGPLRQRQEAILTRCLGLLDDWLGQGGGSPEALNAFGRDLRPALLANAQDAAALQLDALHRAVSGWRKAMPAAEWASLRVLLIGAHMARDGEVTWQYFSRLLGQPVEGDRIIYAEGRWELKDALDLLATHGVDRALGATFFGDPGRMHRDVLGDGAAAWLDSHPLK